METERRADDFGPERSRRHGFLSSALAFFPAVVSESCVTLAACFTVCFALARDGLS